MKTELVIGPLEHQTDGSELRAFGALLEKSRHFALVNSGAEMDGFHPDAGTKKKRRLKGLFEGIEFLLAEEFEYLRLYEWPGTKAGDERFMVRGPLTAEAKRFLTDHTGQLYETYADGWDDLSLLRGDRLVFYNCTHEGFGSIFGDEEFFRALPISVDPKPPSYTEYRIHGDTLPRELVLGLV